MQLERRLNYSGFEDYYVTHGIDKGTVYYIFRFNNGYGAVVYRSLHDSEIDNSYPWKLAAIRFHNDHDGYKILYEELITLNDAEVRKVFNNIKNYPTFIANSH